MTLSLPFERLRVRQAHPTSKYPEEDRGALSLSNGQVERQNAPCVGPDPTKTVRITRREPSEGDVLWGSFFCIGVHETLFKLSSNLGTVS